MVSTILLYIAALGNLLLAYLHALVGELPQIVLSLGAASCFALTATLKLIYDNI